MIAGNGISVIDDCVALIVITTGDTDHFSQMLLMKYAESKNTKMNAKKKNILWYPNWVKIDRKKGELLVTVINL